MNTTSPGSQDRNERDERDFFRIATIATALGMATLGAFLASIKDVAHDASLEFSLWTVVAFVGCGVMGWVFWPLLRRLSQKHTKSSSLPSGADTNHEH